MKRRYRSSHDDISLHRETYHGRIYFVGGFYIYVLISSIIGMDNCRGILY